MADQTLFAQVLDPANRPNPYALYARLREQAVAPQSDGTYVVSRYAAVRSLVFDPRLSSEDLPPSRRPRTGNFFKDWVLNRIKDRITNAHRPLIFRDPPAHDRLRGAVMRELTADRVRALHGRIAGLVDQLIEQVRGRDEVCLVDDLSYPLPVAVICELLGVPPEDESRFQNWATQLASALEPDARGDEETRRSNARNFDEISAYMRKLVRRKRRSPTGDLLSGLLANSGPDGIGSEEFDLISTAILLLIAGHETTVNLITNGMLTLLRHPQEMRKLRDDPSRAPRTIEEILRYEPPVQFRTRKALADIDVQGERIPAGAPVVLLFAAANRDPTQFEEPERFNPDRRDNQHFSFGGGLHYCIGAPLARIEAEIALLALCNRLVTPRLLQDPPPYRRGASLRGPKNLGIWIGGVVGRDPAPPSP
ncbi:MAG: cytochrome P450 [Hansschlegelia sp.]